MTKVQWAILGTLAVAVLCVFGALGFVVIRDFRRDVSSVAVASTPTIAVADSTSMAQNSSGAVSVTATVVPAASQAGTESGQAGGEKGKAAEGPASSGATGGVSAFTGELPADPLAATSLIQSQAQTIQSAHIVMDFSVQVHATPAAGEGSSGAPFPDDIKVAAEGDFVEHGADQPPDMHLTLRVQAQGESHTLELVQVDGRQWANTDGKWEENKDFQQKATSGGDFTTNPLTMLFAMEAMGNVDRLPDENIDGVPAYHYRFSVDPQKILSSKEFSDGPVNSNMFAALFQDLTMQVEVWADQEHLWMRQEKLLLHANMAGPAADGQPASSVELQLEGLIKMSHFNEPVTIKPPV